jgi:hypothetical protein
MKMAQKIGTKNSRKSNLRYEKLKKIWENQKNLAENIRQK